MSGRDSTQANIRSCCICGCTDGSPCLDVYTGEPCHWVTHDVCSACYVSGQRDVSASVLDACMDKSCADCAECSMIVRVVEPVTAQSVVAAMPEVFRPFAHQLRNTLTAISMASYIGNYSLVREAVVQMNKDLREVGL